MVVLFYKFLVSTIITNFGIKNAKNYKKKLQNFH